MVCVQGKCINVPGSAGDFVGGESMSSLTLISSGLAGAEVGDSAGADVGDSAAGIAIISSTCFISSQLV